MTRQSRTLEVWRTESEIETDLHLVGGEEFTAPFALALPSPNPVEPEDTLPDWARGTIAVINTVTFRRSDLQWQLRARLRHAAGFDLKHHLPLLVDPR